MINKRLLIKNLLGHSDENSFYDRKRFIDLSSTEGKAKFLKLVCALANSNPKNSAFIVIGVEDDSRKIVGVDFFDDSRIQNLVNAFLDNAPNITYENIIFPELPENKVVGLVTVSSSGKICSLHKGIWKYPAGIIFYREGSNSKPKTVESKPNLTNATIVAEIEKKSKNNIKHSLDGVIDFIYHRHKDLQANYLVYEEQFILCWAGKSKISNDKIYYTRVDIELINEQVRLFFSALDEVEISYTENSFSIVEYIQLGINGNQKYYPLEKTDIYFFNNGSYKIEQKLIFKPPVFEPSVIESVWQVSSILFDKIENEMTLSEKEKEQLKTLPFVALLCYLNGVGEAKQRMENIRPLLKTIDVEAYISLKESLRILRKIKYNS
ncbi:ATP-binding protein [Capnocytophaga canimorsus]|uniref:AAA family ATPase n=1 Tax=Capnocytophaga canimorsus TaxID=28188 RepID=A0AAD0EAF6_9FLAO|nr:ATP-binding protein [Capnocytophaga canimorsus]ATA94116.1 AAA family ATPase [Capnocytophaga canimorsus]